MWYMNERRDGFEEKSLLRVHQGRLGEGDAERRGVGPRRADDPTPETTGRGGGDGRRLGRIGRARQVVVPSVPRERGDAVSGREGRRVRVGRARGAAARRPPIPKSKPRSTRRRNPGGSRRTRSPRHRGTRRALGRRRHPRGRRCSRRPSIFPAGTSSVALFFLLLYFRGEVPRERLDGRVIERGGGG